MPLQPEPAPAEPWKGWGFCGWCNETSEWADYCSNWCAELDRAREHKKGVKTR